MAQITNKAEPITEVVRPAITARVKGHSICIEPTGWSTSAAPQGGGASFVTSDLTVSKDLIGAYVTIFVDEHPAWAGVITGYNFNFSPGNPPRQEVRLTAASLWQALADKAILTNIIGAGVGASHFLEFLQGHTHYWWKEAKPAVNAYYINTQCAGGPVIYGNLAGGFVTIPPPISYFPCEGDGVEGADPILNTQIAITNEYKRPININGKTIAEILLMITKDQEIDCLFIRPTGRIDGKGSNKGKSLLGTVVSKQFADTEKTLRLDTSVEAISGNVDYGNVVTRIDLKGGPRTNAVYGALKPAWEATLEQRWLDLRGNPKQQQQECWAIGRVWFIECEGDMPDQSSLPHSDAIPEGEAQERGLWNHNTYNDGLDRRIVAGPEGGADIVGWRSPANATGSAKIWKRVPIERDSTVYETEAARVSSLSPKEDDEEWQVADNYQFVRYEDVAPYLGQPHAFGTVAPMEVKTNKYSTVIFDEPQLLCNVEMDNDLMQFMPTNIYVCELVSESMSTYGRVNLFTEQEDAYPRPRNRYFIDDSYKSHSADPITVGDSISSFMTARYQRAINGRKEVKGFEVMTYDDSSKALTHIKNRLSVLSKPNANVSVVISGIDTSWEPGDRIVGIIDGCENAIMSGIELTVKQVSVSLAGAATNTILSLETLRYE